MAEEASRTAEADSQSTHEDEYAYLENSGFTSEKFKIEIRNLPKFYGPGELKKLLNDKLKLEANKIKFPAKQGIWAYVCFRTEESRQNAIKVLNGYNWKGNVLSAEEAKPAPDPLVKRRNENREFETNKKLKIDSQPLGERLKDATTPLWRLEYDEQVDKRRERSTNFSAEENRLLVELVEKRKAILENKCRDLVTWKRKERAWKELEVEFNDYSGGTYRCVKNLKIKYDGMKKEVRKKVACLKRAELCRPKTGVNDGASATANGFTWLEEKVKDLIFGSIDGHVSAFDGDRVMNDSEVALNGWLKEEKEDCEPARSKECIMSEEDVSNPGNNSSIGSSPVHLENSRMKSRRESSLDVFAVSRMELIELQKANVRHEMDKRALEMEILAQQKQMNTYKLELLRLELKIKQKNVEDLLKKFGSELVKVNPSLREWWNEQKDKYNGLPCELLPIRFVEPGEDGYRNKCEFTIGLNEETNEKTVGFRIGSYAQGTLCVAPVDDIKSVPQVMKSAAKLFQNYVRTSKYDVYNNATYKGYWRQLTVRYGFRTKQLMLIIGLHCQNMPDAELDELKEDLIKYFTEDSNECDVTSFYLQIIEKRKASSSEREFIHLCGETHIYEQLFDYKFRISPDAFFQINTSSAELMYKSVAELSDLTGEDCLLDVCCGTGTIGISLSKKCKEILGLEISSQAISDAKVNATENNVTNSQFFTGKAEEILSSVAYRANSSNIVAIVDPPRAGLHQNGVVQLRKTKPLNKLVYVSCEAKLAMRNFIDLGRQTSKVYQRSPFLPVKAVAVDMFPYTNHFELLIYFERYQNIEEKS